MKSSMIVVASEQIWPNLLGFLHWHRKLGGIDRLFIYSTEDERRSLGPARRLKELIASIHPETEILPEHDEAHGMTPEAVSLNVSEWMRLHPAERWVMNLTGGTKLMTAGLLDFVGEPGIEMVYRELGKGWIRLGRESETRKVFSRSIDGVDEGIADTIAIGNLVRTQFDVACGDRWDISAARKLPIVSILKEAIEVDWDWKKAFDAADVPFDTRKTGGMLFEEFVASCLLELGITNVMINARHVSSKKADRQEIDILASSNGVLYLVDCKLAYPDDPAVPAAIAQIKEAAETTRTLGGLSAETLMIRPSWDEDDDRTDFARALGVRIIQRGSTTTLLPQLGEWTGGRPLSPTLQKAQELIIDLRKRFKYPFSSTKARLIKNKEERRSPLVSLNHEMCMFMDEECQDWACVSWENTSHFLFRPKVAECVLKNALVRILESYGQVVLAEYSNSKSTLAIDLVPRIECLKALRSMLETKKHKSWLDTLVIEERDRQEAPRTQHPNTTPKPDGVQQK